jgi:hypothetical protein
MYTKKQIPFPFFSQARRLPIKQAPSIIPHPDIISKFQDDKGNLIDNKKNAVQNGNGDIVVEKKKKKKKNLPCEKLIKKLVGHKDPDADNKKMKKIVSAIERYVNDEL